jgi:hypothetical protein
VEGTNSRPGLMPLSRDVLFDFPIPTTYLLFEVILPGSRRLLTGFEGYLHPSPISAITAASTAGFGSPSAVAISSFGTNRIEGRIRAVMTDPAITQ